MSNNTKIPKNRTWNGKVLDKHSFTEIALNSGGHFEGMLENYFKKHKLGIKITWEKHPSVNGYIINFQVPRDIMTEASKLLAEVMPYSYSIEPIPKKTLAIYL